MASASDDFNRANSGDLGANWTTNEGGGPALSGNAAVGADGGYGSDFYNAVSFTADHLSQITKIGADDYVAPAVRMTSGRNWYAYFSHGEIQSNIGGSTGGISSASAYGAGDVAKLEISGSTLSWYVNGVLDGSFFDPSLSTGQPGVATFDTSGTLDDWSGADLGAAATIVRQMVAHHG